LAVTIKPDTSDYVIAVGFGGSARGQASGVGWIDRARGWAADLWLGSRLCVVHRAGAVLPWS
jgi:hypothetical protein